MHISPTRPGTPQIIRQSNLLAHLDKGAVPLILKQDQSAVTGHQHNLQPIAVEIANRCGVRVMARLIDECRPRDFLEAFSVKVPKQTRTAPFESKLWIDGTATN